MFIDDNNNIKVGGNGGQRLPGNIKFDISNGKFDFDGDRKMLKFNSDIDFKFFYPNSYIFCISQEPDKNSIDPKRIDDSYDSYYIFSEQKLPILMQYISNALSNTVRLEDINSIDLIQKAPLAKLMSGLECRPIVSTVNYVAEKNLVVTNPDQFNQNSLFDLYFKGLFKKNDKYQGDNELRIVFPIRHVNFGFLSVKKTPIHLNLKPILECLDER